jgi:hypothetical protein
MKQTDWSFNNLIEKTGTSGGEFSILKVNYNFVFARLTRGKRRCLLA